jgi:hypothetical protein
VLGQVIRANTAVPLSNFVGNCTGQLGRLFAAENAIYIGCGATPSVYPLGRDDYEHR